MKRSGLLGLWILIIAALLVFALQIQSMAGGGKNQVQESRKDFALVGTVVSADPETGCVYIKVLSGFGPIEAYIGDDKPALELTTDAATQFSPAGLSLATMAEGDDIRASGYYFSSDDVFLAYVVASP